MKKLVVSLLLLASAFVAEAQSVVSHADCMSFTVQGSAALNIYENAFSYREHGNAIDLFTYQGAVGIGYDFTEAFGVRGQVAYGYDAGAANSYQSGGGFYPYKFKHINFFIDAVLNLRGLKGRATAFRPRIYTGVGLANTFGFTGTDKNEYFKSDGKIHPWQWQEITDKNKVFGFRAGLILEYTFPSGFGFITDMCGEAFLDKYDGLQPGKNEQPAKGYVGFPFDLRGLVSIGMVYYF